MFCLPKTNVISIGTRFTVASKNCSPKLFSNTISKAFKMIFNNVESFYDKSFFYSGCIKFQMVQNSFPIVTNLYKINVKRKAKSTSTFDLSTLHKTILSLNKILVYQWIYIYIYIYIYYISDTILGQPDLFLSLFL